jgi:hypothetical protein
MNKTMRSAMALAAGWGLVGLAMPASATLELLVVVNKDKNVNVLVDLFVEKFIDIDVTLIREVDGAAEAHALANVVNKYNKVKACDKSCEIGGPAISYNIDLDATLTDSVKDNDGIVGLNQDVGNMVNQANLLAMARTEFTDDARRMVSDAEAEIDQVNKHNVARQRETLPDPPFSDPDHTATITNSITGNDGVVGVNQNSGNMNNQTNAVAMVIGAGNAIVLTEASLGQENAHNKVVGINTVKIDLIEESIIGNNGIVSVNQSVGNMNNQGSAIAFGALTTTATIGVPGS